MKYPVTNIFVKEQQRSCKRSSHSSSSPPLLLPSVVLVLIRSLLSTLNHQAPKSLINGANETTKSIPTPYYMEVSPWINSRGSREGSRPPLFLDQTPRNIFGDRPPSLISGSRWPDPPYLKVWICHWLRRWRVPLLSCPWKSWDCK